MNPLIKLIYKFKSFFRRMCNIVRWFPTIWKDADWDEEYIFLILLTKLRHKEKMFRNKAMVLDGENIANEIKEYIEVLERMLDLNKEHVYYKQACEQIGVESYRDIYDAHNLEVELYKKDIEKIFSKELSEKITRWWD